MNKLVYITNQICGPGGLERVLSIKASLLADKFGYEVHILTLNQNKTPLFYTFSNKIHYHNINASGNFIVKFFSYLSGLKKAIQSINPDVISVCDDGLKGLLLPILLGKPCPMVYERHVSKNIEIKSEHASILRKVKTQMKFALMNFGGARYDAFVVLTNGNKKEWPLKNVQVIPNPLSFYPDKNQLSTLKNRTVIAVGKQSYQKSYDRLLKAWKTVNQKHPDWVLDIYGTITPSEGLEDMAKEMKISEAVNFYQPVKNIAEKYQEASIYAMSSRYEGFGMVLTEAMAYGVPCVSFNCPYGPGDIIINENNGFLVPNGDIDDFADKLALLIENDQLRQTMGIRARKHVDRFLPETIVDRWNSLFKQLIKG